MITTSRRLLACAAPIFAALLLGACSQGNSGDPSPPPAVASNEPNSFLLFPNPQVQADGSFQTNTTAYTQAYYAAIDPLNAKDTLAKWKAANGFGSGTGTEVTVVFQDLRDLGYGRRMTARQNLDGTIAMIVVNYKVTSNDAAGYSSLNIDAAVVQDQRWVLGYNAIEYSPGPAGGASFPKFFNFDATAGQRQLTVDLDGRGEKAMPGPCIVCHGGRGDPLTPPDATGQPRFPLMPNSVSSTRGDTLAHLLPLEVGTFGFSATAGFTRSDQEAALKTLNKMVLCSYPLPAASAFPEDACRRAATFSEWRGTAAPLLKAAYGGDGLPNATYSDNFIPAGWVGPQQALYQSVVAPACRSCHIARGIGSQSDIDFDSLAKFQGYSEDIRDHAYNRGNMPLARLPFQDFFAEGQAETLANFLQAQGFPARDGGGAVLRPGRPVADPGPDRTVRQGPVALSANLSLFSTTYSWSIVSGPGGAVPPANVTLSDPASANPTFNASADGTYVVQLVASNAGAQSAPAQLTLVVNNALAPAPASIRFLGAGGIKNALQTLGCTGCHSPGGGTPIVYTNTDRNGDGSVGDATDDLWFYTEVRGRINFLDLSDSPLLRKPAGEHHGGGLQAAFNRTLAPGQAGRANYDLFLNWILNGAPM